MDVKAGRYTAQHPDEFVVFFIGMRINKIWRVREWLPVIRSAFAMVKELRELPDSPMLESRTMLSVRDWRVPLFIQYWRSFDELEEWARNKDLRHRPAQTEFFRRTAFNGNVGVFHETFRVEAGQFEAIYANMPRILLAQVGEYVPLRPTSNARARLNAHRSSSG